MFGGSGVSSFRTAGSVVRPLLVAMVLVAAIWQSTGLAVARVHMLLNGIDLHQSPQERNSAKGIRVGRCGSR